MNDAEIEAYLSKRELAIVAHSTYDRLKPVRDLFCKNNIPGIILRGESCGAGCSCKGGLGELDLAVAVEDVERAVEVLESQFSDMIGSVADDAELDLVGQGRAEVNLEAEELICPACGEKLPGGQVECPECGLYLGIPEEK